MGLPIGHPYPRYESFEMTDEVPLGYFITWTVYGTHLPGDERWWLHRTKGEQQPQPRLQEWHAANLNHSIRLLNRDDVLVTQEAIEEIGNHRNWQIWARAVRTNHVHVVISTSRHHGKLTRDQIKAKCTKQLRLADSSWLNRPVWTTGGYVSFLYSQSDIEKASVYVKVAQDRKHLEGS